MKLHFLINFEDAMTLKRLFEFILVFGLLSHSFYGYANPGHLPNASMDFLVLSDLHFDPFIACYEVSQKPCAMITQLRAASPDHWASILEREDKTQPLYRRDTNYPLLISSLNAAKKTIASHQAQFVLVLGDFLGHDFRRYYKKYAQDKSYAGYQSFVKKTFIFLTNEIARAFPTTDVYIIMGNNDSYRQDYYTDSRGPFFHDMANLGSRLIKTKTNRIIMEHDFSVGGYYAVNVPGRDSIRLIMLNSVLFSTRAKGNNITQSARQQLKWLHSELQAAKENHQRVLIAMHIPEGVDVYALRRVRLFRLVDLWQADYIKQFQTEIQTFAPEIIAVLAGHLHMDWYQIQQFNKVDNIPFIGVPSISPIFGNNPKFKIYHYSSISQQLNDRKTYYYLIHEARDYWIFTGS